jgi:uncharacterized membrane protein YjjP (DUF1212 family)
MSELGLRGALPATTEGLAMELVLRVGEMMQSAGMSTSDTIRTMSRILDVYGLNRAQVDITHTSIVASYYPGDGLPPITSVRLVKPSEVNLTKVTDINRLTRSIEEGLKLEDAMRAFDVLRAARPPFPNWAMVLGASSISAAVQLLYTTSPRVLLIALVTGVLLNRFVYALSRVGLPPFFLQLAGGWFIVAYTTFVYWAGETLGWAFFDGLDPSLIAVGGVFQLVAGMKFVSAVQDAIDTHYLTASARILQVVMLTVGIVAGLVSGLDVAARLGAEFFISPEMPVMGSLTGQFAGAAMTALVYVVGQYTDLRTAVLSMAAALIAWALYVFALAELVGDIFANFAGALAAAFLATLVVRRSSIPGFAVVNAAVIPLVPGLRLYAGLIQMVGGTGAEGNLSHGADTLGLAAAIALAIAAGASLGTFFARPLGDRLMVLPRTWYERMRAPKSHATRPVA